MRTWRGRTIRRRIVWDAAWWLLGMGAGIGIVLWSSPKPMRGFLPGETTVDTVLDFAMPVWPDSSAWRDSAYHVLR